MRSTLKWLAAALLTIPVTTNAQQATTHPEVAEALAWELPAHECVPPKQTIRNQATTTGALGDNSFGSNEELGGGVVDYDTNSVDRSRIERARKRYGKCLEEYRQELVDEFGRIKSVVRHGVTEAQARQLLEKLAMIQKTIESPDAKPPAQN